MACSSLTKCPVLGLDSMGDFAYVNQELNVEPPGSVSSSL